MGCGGSTAAPPQQTVGCGDSGGRDWETTQAGSGPYHGCETATTQSGGHKHQNIVHDNITINDITPESLIDSIDPDLYNFTWSEDDELIKLKDKYLVETLQEKKELPSPPAPPEDNSPYLLNQDLSDVPNDLTVEPDADDDAQNVSPHFAEDHEHLTGFLKYVVTVPRNPGHTDNLMEKPEVPPGEKWVDKSFTKQVALKGMTVASDSNVTWNRPCEIMKNVALFKGVTDRFDIKQGSAGTCFFLSVVAVIADKEEIMKQIFPEDAYNEDTGVVHVRLWKFGRFHDIYMDDFIAVSHGEPWGAGCKKGELWVSFLEKALAKMSGGYANCSGGYLADGFAALTGGLSEIYDLSLEKGKEKAMWKRLSNCLSSESVATAEVPAKLNGKDLGLVTLHAYSITGTAEVTSSEKKVHLVRLRNPWGTTEWTGAWSDNSAKWNSVENSLREQLLRKRLDGEFWMSMVSFCSRFRNCVISSISPDVDSDGIIDGLDHVVCMYGEWKGDTAASWKRPMDNPLYRVELVGSDDKIPVVFELIQNCSIKKDGVKAVSLKVWKMKSTQSGYVLEPKSCESTFKHSESVCVRMFTEPGCYLVAPITYVEGDEGEFLLRVFTKQLGTGSIFEKESSLLFKDKGINSFKYQGTEYNTGCEQILSGQWIKGVSAGGWCSFPTFHTNPQYLITIPPGKTQPLTMSVVQADIKNLLTTGARLYLYEDGVSLPLSQQYLNEHWDSCPSTTSKGSKDLYIMKSPCTTSHYLLTPGRYVAIPTTSEVDAENAFVLIIKSVDDLDIQCYNN